MEDNILCGLNGKPLEHTFLSQAVSTLVGEAVTVSDVSVVDGTENCFPTSHSAVLQLTTGTSEPVLLFVKKVAATSMAHKAWPDRRRTLCYARTELRFYGEFGSILAEKGVCMPRVVASDGRLSVLGDNEVAGDPGEEPPQSELEDCGAVLMLECASSGLYEQGSPLPAEKAVRTLRAIAHFHAAAWEDTQLLTAAAARLQRHGGSFSLTIRNPKELTKVEGNWERFVEIFSPHAPELFARPSIRAFGKRLRHLSEWVSEQLTIEPSDPCATLCHGDFKAMNVFTPLAAGGDAMLIDFASTGVGLGMSDVSMHLAHSVELGALADGGEERLVEAYLEALEEARGAGATPYPRDLAKRHYRLGSIDYCRFVVGRFWGNASPEVFETKADSPNTTLVNRSTVAALRYVQRVDEYMATFEAELEEEQ